MRAKARLQPGTLHVWVGAPAAVAGLRRPAATSAVGSGEAGESASKPREEVEDPGDALRPDVRALLRGLAVFPASPSARRRGRRRGGEGVMGASAAVGAPSGTVVVGGVNSDPALAATPSSCGPKHAGPGGQCITTGGEMGDEGGIWEELPAGLSACPAVKPDHTAWSKSAGPPATSANSSAITLSRGRVRPGAGVVGVERPNGWFGVLLTCSHTLESKEMPS